MDALLTKRKPAPAPDRYSEAKQKISGSQALLRSLVAEDVNILFGYPGGACIALSSMYSSLFVTN